MLWFHPPARTAAEIAAPAKSNPKVTAAPVNTVTVTLTKEEVIAALVAAAISAEPNAGEMTYQKFELATYGWEDTGTCRVTFTAPRGA